MQKLKLLNQQYLTKNTAVDLKKQCVDSNESVNHLFIHIIKVNFLNELTH